MADPQDMPDDVLRNVSVEVRVCVGKAHPAVAELLALNEGSVLNLDKGVDDPVEMFVGDRLIATGHLEEVEGGAPGQLAIRIEAVGESGKSAA